MKPSQSRRPRTTHREIGTFLMGASPAVLRSRTPGRPPNVVLIIRDQTRDLATSFIAIPDASMANLERLSAVGT